MPSYYNNAEHQRVNRILRKAVVDGLVTPSDSCETCHSDGPLEGHHEDYSKPLEVEWLCETCHRRHRRDADLAKKRSQMLPEQLSLYLIARKART